MNILNKLPSSTLILIAVFFLSLFGLLSVSSFDFRNLALTNVSVPGSKYNLFYQLDDNQNNILSSNLKLKTAVVNSVNSLSVKNNEEVYIMDLIEMGPSVVGIIKVVAPDSSNVEEGYLSGTVYKFLYVQKIDGNYDYTINTNLKKVQSILSTNYARAKLTREYLDKVDNLLFEGNSSLFQTKSISPLPPPTGSVTGVTYKFPWASALGDWKITGSWHGGSFYINGSYYRETALDVKSPLFTTTYEAANEVEVLSPISGIIHSRCNYDPYNNGYVLIKGDDGIYYSVIHIKVNTLTVKAGDRVLQGQRLGYMFEDGLNQDKWSGGGTSGRCAWAAGTHIHIGMIPVNNNNLVSGIRIYDLDGIEMHYPNNNGNASVGKIIKSTQQGTGVVVTPSPTSSTTTTTIVTNTATTSASTNVVVNIIPKYNLNTRVCADTITKCKIIYPILAYRATTKVNCKFTNSKNVTWVRIDNNVLNSTSNNKWVIATSYYANITINGSSASISDARIPICPSGDL